MSTLLGFAFPTENGAYDALPVLRDLQHHHQLGVEDAEIVVHAQDGASRVEEVTSLVSDGAWGGAFWGLLGGLIHRHRDVGIDHDFIREVEGKVQPGHSALFMHVREVDIDHVLSALRPYEPEVLQTSLSAEQEAQLRDALHSHRSAAVVAAPAAAENGATLHVSTPTEVLAPLEPGFRYLFDNSVDAVQNWRFVGGGGFAVVDGALEVQPGNDWGLLYYTAETFGDFALRMDVRLDRIDSDSGVFVRFRDPSKPVPDRVDPTIAYAYDKEQWVADTTGFEVQIDELARGSDDEREEHRTGAIYDVPVGSGVGEQQYEHKAVLTPSVWHQLEILVNDNTYQVNLDGTPTTAFTNADPLRGQPPRDDAASGYIGLQSFLGHVAFRSVRIKTT
jgi:uncharacterized membrane protein